jgi:hypothetical protein
MASWLETWSAKKRLLWSLFGVLWVIAIGTGLAMLAGYSNSPGAMQTVPLDWPMGSSIPLSHRHPTLVLFAHPRCPCTRASLGELEKIVARYPDAVAPWVVFLRPGGADDNWEKTDLRETAAAIPGVHVISDLRGAEARRFHAATSGQTLLYSDQGKLLFSGGITYARGHSGDNAGRAAIESCLAGHWQGYCQTPVFGCPIAATREKELGAP